jgi:uncharacterized membrane protein YfcA
MTWTVLVAMSAIVALAGFVQGSTGVGFALIVAPVLGLVAPELLPVTVLVLMLPLNIYVAWRERAALDLRSGAWITAGRLAGTFAGLWVLVALSVSHLNILIGVSTIAAAVATLAMPVFRPSRSVYVAAGLVTGVTETATGIGGPPLALVYQHHPAPVMRSTIALCFLVGELISLAFLWQAGRIASPQLMGAAQMLPALGAGALLSRLVHRHVNARALRIFMMSFSIVSGAVLLLRP